MPLCREEAGLRCENTGAARCTGKTACKLWSTRAPPQSLISPVLPSLPPRSRPAPAAPAACWPATATSGGRPATQTTARACGGAAPRRRAGSLVRPAWRWCAESSCPGRALCGAISVPHDRPPPRPPRTRRRRHCVSGERAARRHGAALASGRERALGVRPPGQACCRSRRPPPPLRSPPLPLRPRYSVRLCRPWRL